MLRDVVGGILAVIVTLIVVMVLSVLTGYLFGLGLSLVR